MNKIEKDIFNFLTKPENFKLMASLRDQYVDIHRELIIGFWNSVKQKIRLKIKNSDWIIWEDLHDFTEENYFDTYSSLSLCKKKYIVTQEDDYPLICVAWENLHSDTHIGLWVNNVSKVLDLTRVKEHVKLLDVAKEYGSNKGYWPLVEYDLNFKNSNDLEKILPPYQKRLSIIYADKLVHLANDLGKDLDKMSRMRI